ncbi:MAG: hypothetical protein PF961_10560 [Planctomycetota bacterium]|nr:hypothetical protein [Planctomycetota bacterium]
MIRWLALCVVVMAMAGAPLAAEVVTYAHGGQIRVLAHQNTGANTEQMRALIFTGVTKLSVMQTWNGDDLDVILAGNTLRVGLHTDQNVEFGLLGDNGVYYAVSVEPAAADVTLSPTITVLADSGGAAADDEKMHGRGGGYDGSRWEHETALVLRLHKHIRGGRTVPQVSGAPAFNEEILFTEGRRVPGRVWHASDDWTVLEYHHWSLGSVRAALVGVTYGGRDPAVRFEYLTQQTDRTIAIFHFTKADARAVFSAKVAGVTMLPGDQEMFIIYERTEGK